MYNGIGLQTARGSGTNGFVTRNMSFIKRHKDKVDYKSEEELAKLDQQMVKGPNQEILTHERKRKVELKCMEMHELMEEQGYTQEEIEKKVSIFRKMLMEKEGVSEKVVERDEDGRPIAKETHQLAEANQEKNQKLRDAFGLSQYYVDGSSLDPQRKAKEDAAKAAEEAKKQYSILRSSSSDRSPSPPSRKKKKKSSSHRSRKKHRKDFKERSESPSPARKDKKKRSSKKAKRDGCVDLR